MRKLCSTIPICKSHNTRMQLEPNDSIRNVPLNLFLLKHFLFGQFCVYVHDNYVVPSLDLQTYKFVKGDLDRLTQEYIHKNLSYRFCHFETEDSIQIVRKIETKIKNGHLGLRPLLNGEE